MKQMKSNVRVMVVVVMLSIMFVMSAVCSAAVETLRMVVWEGYAPEDLRQKFITMVKEKYGVDLTIDVKYVSVGDDFFPALRDGQADIVSPSHNVPKDKRFQFMTFKLVLPLDLNNIPNYTRLIPVLQKSPYVSEGEATFGVPISQGPYGLAYNTALVSEPPTTWNSLWDSKFKNQYALSQDYYEVNMYITALSMGIAPQDIGKYEKLNTPEFQEKLAQLVSNAHSMWAAVDRAEDLKGLTLATSWGFALPGLKQMGEIWKIATPQEGTTGWFDSLMLSQTLENQPQLKRIAEEWLNYALSNEFQLHIARNVGYTPTTTTVRELLTPEEVAQLHLDDPTYFEKHYIPWPVLDKLDRKGFERLWKEAVAKRK